MRHLQHPAAGAADPHGRHAAGPPLPPKSIPGYPAQTTHGAKEGYRNTGSSLRSNGHYLAGIPAKQSLNRPVTVTEFAGCAPNPHRHEMGLFFTSSTVFAIRHTSFTLEISGS